MDDADVLSNRISRAQSILPSKAVNSVPYIDFRALDAALAAVAEIYFGTVTGTGASIVVSGLPFDPAFILLMNVTDPTLGFYIPGMAAASVVKLIDGSVALTVPTSLGITLGAKGARAFTIGADTDLNVNTEVIRYVAIGSRGSFGL